MSKYRLVSAQRKYNDPFGYFAVQIFNLTFQNFDFVKFHLDFLFQNATQVSEHVVTTSGSSNQPADLLKHYLLVWKSTKNYHKAKPTVQ